MTAATRLLRSAAAIAHREGEWVTYTPEYGATVPIECVWMAAPGTAFLGGELTIDEGRQTGHIQTAALATPPAAGESITRADGTRYVIDAPPVETSGFWSMTLRKMQ